MNRFVVFDGTIPDQKVEWLKYYHKWGKAEQAAHPDYSKLFTAQGERNCCAVHEQADGLVLFPFVWRPIGQMEWASNFADFSDIVTPYGYGGAFYSGSPNVDLFWDTFDGWAAEHKVVSLFARLSLFPEQILPFRGETEEKLQNIVRGLTLTEEDLWKDFEHKVRKNVARANKENLRVVVDPSGEHLDAFLKIYFETLNRRGALQGYYFPETFFRELVSSIPENCCYFHVYDGDQIISTELVLISADNIYSFLGGTLSEAYQKRPNDLLKYEIMRWGIKQGKKTFILGGGYQPDDGIFQYKKSFAPTSIVPFFVGKRIFNAKVYQSLIDARPGEDETAGYFPAYRKPV